LGVDVCDVCVFVSMLGVVDNVGFAFDEVNLSVLWGRHGGDGGAVGGDFSMADDVEPDADLVVLGGGHGCGVVGRHTAVVRCIVPVKMEESKKRE